MICAIDGYRVSGRAVPLRRLIAAIGVVLWASGPVLAQASPARGRPTAPPARSEPRRPPGRLEALASEVVRATRAYRESLVRLLAVRERQQAEAAAGLEERRDLRARGAIDARDLEQAERDLTAADENVAETRQWLQEADAILLEAVVVEMVSRLAPLPRGGYEETATLIRYAGVRPWSLRELPRLERFFAERFGRPLPVSALGQSPAHDRLGFDHRDAADVAVHPDSGEGRALMAWLRQAGMPFIAVRGIVPGAATGAHIHVGPPSPRLSLRP